MSLWNDFWDGVEGVVNDVGDTLQNTWDAIKSNPIGAITSAVAMAYGIPPAWAGALGGAAGAAASGGDIVKAAITGGAMGYFGEAAGAAAGGAGPIAQAAAAGAAAGVTGAVLTGQDVMTALKQGLILGTVVGAGQQAYKLMSPEEAMSSVPKSTLAEAQAVRMEGGDPIAYINEQMGWTKSNSSWWAANDVYNEAVNNGTLTQYYQDQIPTDVLREAAQTSNPQQYIKEQMGWGNVTNYNQAASSALAEYKAGIATTAAGKVYTGNGEVSGTPTDYAKQQMQDLANARANILGTSDTNITTTAAENVIKDSAGVWTSRVDAAMATDDPVAYLRTHGGLSTEVAQQVVDYRNALSYAKNYVPPTANSINLPTGETQYNQQLPDWAPENGIVVKTSDGTLGVFNPETGYTISYDGNTLLSRPGQSYVPQTNTPTTTPTSSTTQPVEPTTTGTTTTGTTTGTVAPVGPSDLAYSIASGNPNVDVSAVQQYLDKGYSIQQISDAVASHPNGGWAGQLLSEVPGTQTTAPTTPQYAQGPTTTVTDAGVEPPPFRVDVGGVPAMQGQGTPIQEYRTPGTDLATPQQVDSGQASWNAAANSWEVPTPAGKLSVGTVTVPPIVVPPTVTTQPVTPTTTPPTTTTPTTTTSTGTVTPPTPQPVTPPTTNTGTVTPPTNTTTQPVTPTQPTVVSTSTRTTFDGSVYKDSQMSDGTVISTLISGPISTSGQTSTGGTTNTNPPLTPPTQEVIPPGSSYVAPVETGTTGTPVDEIPHHDATTDTTDTTDTTTPTDTTTTPIVPIVIPPTTTPTEDTTYGHYTLGEPVHPAVPHTLNPGWITNVPAHYQTTNPAQSRFYWGAHPYQTGTTFDPTLYNNLPYAPQQAWGSKFAQTSATPQQIMQAMQGVYPLLNSQTTPVQP